VIGSPLASHTVHYAALICSSKASLTTLLLWESHDAANRIVHSHTLSLTHHTLVTLYRSARRVRVTRRTRRRWRREVMRD
jgi:hypothetical protein